MKLRYFFSLIMITQVMTAAASDYDLQKPFGFCTRSSRTSTASSSAYNQTGGGCYTYPVTGVESSKVTVLKSTGGDMKSAIEKAIKQYSVVIFDGSQGDFLISSNVGITSSNRTLLGINGARLCTQWNVTPEMTAALDQATDSRTPGIVGVKNMSTNADDNLGGTVNGSYIKEQAEYITRKILFQMIGNENYRNSGLLTVSGAKNIIIRNLKLVGPGAIDVGGSDLLSFVGGANHCWVDHCDFTDGMDGNFDITQSSDYNTVSWCTFSYTDYSYMHQNTNLIGSSDSEATGYLNTTFAFCWWGANCRARMPMARVGKIHLFNNYFTSTTAGNCVNPRKNSEFLVEGNYFGEGVKYYYGQSGAKAVTWKTNNYVASPGYQDAPESFGTTVTVPYEYSVANNSVVPTEVSSNAGATLYKDVTGIETIRSPFDDDSQRPVYNLAGQRISENTRGLVIVNGRLVIRK